MIGPPFVAAPSSRATASRADSDPVVYGTCTVAWWRWSKFEARAPPQVQPVLRNHLASLPSPPNAASSMAFAERVLQARREAVVQPPRN